MKQLLLVALVLFVTTVKGQKSKDTSFVDGVFIDSFMPDKVEKKIGNLIFNLKNDTLFVCNYNMVKFIKIGDRVYKIESPTLTEVPKGLNLSGSWLDNSSLYLQPSDTTFWRRLFLINGQ